MIPPPKEFRVRLSFEGDCFRVDFEEGGERYAIVSEPMTGDFSNDTWQAHNLRDVIVQTMLERFYPELCAPYKSEFEGVSGMQRSVIDSEKMAERKVQHMTNFATKAA